MTRWLLKGLIDDHIQLTPEQRHAVHTRVKLLFGTHWWATIVMMIPGMLPLIAIPIWREVAKSWPMMWRVSAEILFALLVLALVAWLFRRMYAKHARFAIRELRFADICHRCGFDLTATALHPDGKICPECGGRTWPIRAIGIDPAAKPWQ